MTDLEGDDEEDGHSDDEEIPDVLPTKRTKNADITRNLNAEMMEEDIAMRQSENAQAYNVVFSDFDESGNSDFDDETNHGRKNCNSNHRNTSNNGTYITKIEIIHIRMLQQINNFL